MSTTCTVPSTRLDSGGLGGRWKKYKTMGDLVARNEIIEHYIYLSKYVVDRLAIQGHASMGHDDLVSCAITGLIDAVERFDPDRGIKFETYAITRIRGTVVDAIRRLDWVPRSSRRMERAVRDAQARLEMQLGRAPDDDELAEELGMTPDGLNQALVDAHQSSVLSLEDSLTGAAGSEVPLTVSDLISGGPDPEEMAERSERTALLRSAIGRLKEREQMVLGLYYDEGLTLKEIGRVLGVTEARVCQIHSKATLRLQGQLARFESVMCG